jgi:hypothetical protein
VTVAAGVPRYADLGAWGDRASAAAPPARDGAAAGERGAARQARFSKYVQCHVPRHSLPTHPLEAGCSIRTSEEPLFPEVEVEVDNAIEV